MKNKATLIKSVNEASAAAPAREEVKAVEKKVEPAKVEEKKVETKATEDKVEKNVAPEKKEVAETKKAAVKKTSAKTTTKVKAEPKVENTIALNYFVQYGGNEVSATTIQEKVKADYVAAGNKESSIKDLKIYIKPEDNRAYYVVNDQYSASVSLL